MSHPFIVTAVLAVLLSSSIVSAEYKWNGSDWIWTDDSKDDGGSVQDTGGGRSGQNSRKFDGAGRNVNNIEGSGDVDDYPDEDDAGSGFSVSGGGGGGGRRNNKNRDRDRDYGVERKYDSGRVTPDRDEYDDDVYSESDDGEDIYVEGNNVDNNNNNDGYYTTPAPPNLNGGNGGPRDRQQPPPRQRSPSASFFAQPGTLAAVVGGAVVGLLCAILCVMFVVYRMRKKDEGSYALDEPKRSPAVNSYSKAPSREFYA